MPTDAELLAEVQAAFGACARPEHFTDHDHCDECREHDETLRAKDRETLCFQDVDNPGWNPINFISIAGLCYYLPALVRIALDERLAHEAPYYPELLHHLSSRYVRYDLLRQCSETQRQAIIHFLAHLSDSRQTLVYEYRCANTLAFAHDFYAHPG